MYEESEHPIAFGCVQLFSWGSSWPAAAPGPKFCTYKCARVRARVWRAHKDRVSKRVKGGEKRREGEGGGRVKKAKKVRW